VSFEEKRNERETYFILFSTSCRPMVEGFLKTLMQRLRGILRQLRFIR
jgi:hypothetical protein